MPTGLHHSTSFLKITGPWSSPSPTYQHTNHQTNPHQEECILILRRWSLMLQNHQLEHLPFRSVDTPPVVDVSVVNIREQCHSAGLNISCNAWLKMLKGSPISWIVIITQKQLWSFHGYLVTTCNYYSPPKIASTNAAMPGAFWRPGSHTPLSQGFARTQAVHLTHPSQVCCNVTHDWIFSKKNK